MRQFIFQFALLLCLLLIGCHAPSRSDQSFDQIRGLVQGKTAKEIESLLGPPDSRQPLLLGDERWIWWNYTYLGGKDYPPEIRDRVVHLQITFANPGLSESGRPPYTKWKIVDPLSVSFVLPQAMLPQTTP